MRPLRCRQRPGRLPSAGPAPPAPSLPTTTLLAAFLFAGLLPPGPVAGQTPEAPQDAGPDALPVIPVTLENGMRLLLLPRQGPPTVSFVVHVPVGSVHESLGNTGIAHFLEHLLFKGSTTVGTRNVEAERALFRRMDAAHDSLLRARARLPDPDTARIARLEARIRVLEDSAQVHVVAGEFDELLSREGARGLNASTGYEATQYYVELPANKAELWFLMEADRMRNPVFREFYTERDVIAEERRSRIENSPAGLLWEAFMGTAFHVHPYGVPPIGHMSDINSLSRQQVGDYYRRHYGPNNTIVAVVGDFEPDSARIWARDYFGPLPGSRPAPPALAREPEQRGERRIRVEHDAEPALMMGWKVPSAYHPDQPALSILANLLVGGRDSRLYRRLVREERLATSVTASISPGGRYPGLFVLNAQPRAPHGPREVEEAVLDELARLADEPPTDDELTRVSRRLEAARVRRLTSNLGLAFQLAESEAFWGDWRETFRVQERMQAVEAEDVLRVVDAYLGAERLTVGVLERP